MKRRFQIFLSVLVFLGLIVGATAIESEIWYWNSDGTEKITPDWAHFLALGVLILGIASPILTWPRPVFLRRRKNGT